VHATQVRELGRTPVGVDLSTGMLRHARGRLPVVQADAHRLPFGDGAFRAVIAVMVHTDICFCGGFADHTDRDAIVIRPGYLDSYWTKQSWTDKGIRDKVGAVHRPLPELLHAFLDAGLKLERFAEGGAPTPNMFAIRARNYRAGPYTA
jgi:Methyltransferase domain